MANATKLPLSSELFLGQWSLKGAPTPKLSAPIDADDTTLQVSTPLKDSTGTIVTGGFLMGIKKNNGWGETIWVPAGAVSADGLTYTGVVRGIKPNGYDYTVGDADFADSHDSGEPVYVVIPAVLPELLRSALQGLIASGGSDFIIGTDASGTVTIKRSTGTGTSVGFLRWYSTSNTTQFSNDGTTWTSISDATASVIFKISATDTTPGYAKDKIIGSSSITVTQTNVGGNETLVLTTSLPDVIDAHEIYTPAYMTGGASAETTIALWDSVSDGSFRVTIDGTAYNIDGLDFTTPVLDMDDVAAVIQAGIRSATGSTETVVWSTDHFIITSADTTVASEVSVLETSTGTVGTDISGAGASDWMDCDTGNGTATAAVINYLADAGKLVKLPASGEKFADEFQNITLANATTITDTSDAESLHNHASADPQKYWQAFNNKACYLTSTTTDSDLTLQGGYGNNTHTIVSSTISDTFTITNTSTTAGHRTRFYRYLNKVLQSNAVSPTWDDFTDGDDIVLEFSIKVDSNASNGKCGFVNSGYIANSSPSALHGCYIDLRKDLKIYLSTYKNGTGTSVDTGLAATGYGEYMRIRMEIKLGQQIKVYLNNVLGYTYTTTANIPDASNAEVITQFFGSYIATAGSASAASFSNSVYTAIKK